MAKTIEQQILKATGVKKQKDGEDRQKYLNRLCTALSDMDEKPWKKLSEEVQEWNNAGVDAIEAKKKIKDFADAEDEDEEEDDEDEKPSKKSKSKKSKKDDDEDEVSPANVYREMLAKAFIAGDDTKKSELLDAVREEGHEIADMTAGAVHTHALSTLKVLKGLGMLKKPKSE